MKLPFSQAGRERGDSTMTPLIDVVFLLLIFFVCTASFQAAEEVLPTSLSISGATAPQSAVEPDPNLDRVIVKIRGDGSDIRWIVNDEPYRGLDEVRGVLAAVAQIDPTLPVILDVGPAIALGNVIDVYDICRLAGFEKIQFAASGGL